MNSSQINDLEKVIRHLGVILLDLRKQNRADGKWVGTQYKAEADDIAHEFLSSKLVKILDVPIISEEDIGSQQEKRPIMYWLIDPIDGTASFAGGYPGFVSQVALIMHGIPVNALVFAPVLDKLYTATIDEGTYLNGIPIKLNTILADPLTLVDNYPEPRGIAITIFQALSCKYYLESGSIGLKICLVAEGVADVFVKDVTVRDWDIAPGHLILKEAGGCLMQFSGQKYEYFGDYEKKGLIATSRQELLERVLMHSKRI
jgi:3'(2'), 5'-bisphosphate nucleotidase/myo-inositol-1(or 4)-monophosphatase